MVILRIHFVFKKYTTFRYDIKHESASQNVKSSWADSQKYSNHLVIMALLVDMQHT